MATHIVEFFVVQGDGKKKPACTSRFQGTQVDNVIPKIIAALRVVNDMHRENLIVAELTDDTDGWIQIRCAKDAALLDNEFGGIDPESPL